MKYGGPCQALASSEANATLVILWCASAPRRGPRTFPTTNSCVEHMTSQPTADMRATLAELTGCRNSVCRI